MLFSYPNYAYSIGCNMIVISVGTNLVLKQKSLRAKSVSKIYKMVVCVCVIAFCHNTTTVKQLQGIPT